MSRYIDADAFIARVEKEAVTPRERINALIIKSAVAEQPTAYDVSKVVEELEEKQYRAEKDMGLSEDIDEMNGYGGMSIAYETAIDIVRKGGGINEID